MPSSSNARNANAADPDMATDEGADDRAARNLENANKQMALAFRSKVAALDSHNAHRERYINGYCKTIGGIQTAVKFFEDTETGKKGVIEIWGEVKNIPRALRAKRGVSDMLDASDDDEIHEHVAAQMAPEPAAAARNDAAAQWTGQEAEDVAVHIEKRKTKKVSAPSAASAKKMQKKTTSSSSSSSSRREGSRSQANRGSNDAEAAPATSYPGTRRSSRVASSSSRTPRPSSSRHEPVIREDQEENHVTQDDGIHQIDEYNLRRSTRAASDDLNSLSDRMNHFEIKSEAGSESTRVFSRESSMAEPVASTSRL